LKIKQLVKTPGNMPGIAKRKNSNKIIIPDVPFSYALDVYLWVLKNWKQLRLKNRLLLLFLDSKNQFISYKLLLIDIPKLIGREVLRLTTRAKASKVILVQDRLEGSPTPTEDILKITLQLKASLETVEVHLLDHILIVPESYISLHGLDTI
jgi:DNA repair protein RadC